jgi:hypothetical protein
MIAGMTRFSDVTEAACTRLRLLIHPRSLNPELGQAHTPRVLQRDHCARMRLAHHYRQWSRLRGSTAIRFCLQAAEQARFKSK